MNRRKNAAAYQVSLSAVKKVHVAKSGIAINKQANPTLAAHAALRFHMKKISNIKNSISCGFIRINIVYDLIDKIYGIL